MQNKKTIITTKVLTKFTLKKKKKIILNASMVLILFKLICSVFYIDVGNVEKVLYRYIYFCELKYLNYSNFSN